MSHLTTNHIRSENRFYVRGEVGYLVITRPIKKETYRVRFDAEDMAWIKPLFPWKIISGRGGYPCVARVVDKSGNEILARRIMATPEGMACDYLNGDSFDLRKANLQNVNRSMLSKRTKRRAARQSKHKYIRWIGSAEKTRSKRRANWFCEIYLGNRKRHGRTFRTVREAVAYRDAWLAANAPELAERMAAGL